MKTNVQEPTSVASENHSTTAAFEALFPKDEEAHHLFRFEDIEAELQAFAETEKERLGIVEEEVEHWSSGEEVEFTKSQRETTTILCSGLTYAQDLFVKAALSGLGYNIQALDVPDVEALNLGKEFGNRGQCNPTYFTVGNLLKHLFHLRDEKGMSVEEICEKYVFLTAGACGPCRFGTYVTEYRKVLHDAGFEGFRVMLFQQQGGLDQATGDDMGLEFTPPFFIGILKALIAGDVLNAVGYRIRPYEVVPGSTDEALTECKAMLAHAFENGTSILRALLRCRKRLNLVEVNRLQSKPKVMVIGEFWAMTTEGDGNYHLQRFLEQEGAEVDVQLVTAWLLYNIWSHTYDTKRRQNLRGVDGGRYGLEGKKPTKKLRTMWMAETALRTVFQTFAKAIGLGQYKLTDMDKLAEISHEYYPNELRGGEGHMEVGKLIQSVEKKKAHMVISVKPFGCMPSSGVSDGVQSLVVKDYPDAIFCPIETSGDGAVNVHSRVQMFLFKARKRAQEEFDAILEEKGLTLEEATTKLRKSRSKATYYPKHQVAGTGANALKEL